MSDVFTTSFAVRPQNHGKFMERVASGMRRNIKRALTECRALALQAVIDATEAAPPASANGEVGAVATGTLRREWKAEVDEPTLSIMLHNGASNPKGLAYARYIEQDRAPGLKAPPTQAILAWLQARHGKGNPRQAYLIAQAIKRRGLTRRRIVQSTRQDSTAAIKKVLYARFQELIRKSSGP